MEPATSSEIRAASSYISTGHLPPPEQVKGLVDEADAVGAGVVAGDGSEGHVRLYGGGHRNMNSRLAIDILD